MLTSHFSFTNDEKAIIHKILQLSQNEYSQLEKDLDAFLDTCKMCEEHHLPYQFYDNQQFYCPKCLTTSNQTPKIFHYIGDENTETFQELNQSLSQYENGKLPEINFEERANKLRNSQKNLLNTDQNNVQDVLEQRRKFVKVQEFISYISIETRNRKMHDEMHYTDDKMRPSLPILEQRDIQNNGDQFQSLFNQFLRRQQ